MAGLAGADTLEQSSRTLQIALLIIQVVIILALRTSGLITGHTIPTTINTLIDQRVDISPRPARRPTRLQIQKSGTPAQRTICGRGTGQTIGGAGSTFACGGWVIGCGAVLEAGQLEVEILGFACVAGCGGVYAA